MEAGAGAMTTDARRADLERDLDLHEADFKDRLLSARRTCAAGRWGLLGQNDESSLPRNFSSSTDAIALLASGAQITQLRERLGFTERTASTSVS
jgi:hypothetical protein